VIFFVQWLLIASSGGAKLGDWMQDIQAQIEKLLARCKLNEDEISVHKNLYNLHMVDLNTKIGQIMGRLDQMQDTEKESVDYVNSEIEEVWKMKAKVISVEEKFEKIVKYKHKCSEL